MWQLLIETIINNCHLLEIINAKITIKIAQKDK